MVHAAFRRLTPSVVLSVLIAQTSEAQRRRRRFVTRDKLLNVIGYVDAHPTSSYLCGCPGCQCCMPTWHSQETPMPPELYGLYTAEEWRSFQSRLHRADEQGHCGFCCGVISVLCCCCIFLVDKYQSRVRDEAWEAENQRLAPLGLRWERFRQSVSTGPLRPCLVHTELRPAYELAHPDARPVSLELPPPDEYHTPEQRVAAERLMYRQLDASLVDRMVWSHSVRSGSAPSAHEASAAGIYAETNLTVPVARYAPSEQTMGDVTIDIVEAMPLEEGLPPSTRCEGETATEA